MRQEPGRTRIRLALLLQKNFPMTSDGKFPVTWRPEWLYPATGAYRTDKSLDCYAWEGFAKCLDERGNELFTIFSVGSFFTMGELLAHEELNMGYDGEITPVMTPN